MMHTHSGNELVVADDAYTQRKGGSCCCSHANNLSGPMYSDKKNGDSDIFTSTSEYEV